MTKEMFVKSSPSSRFSKSAQEMSSAAAEVYFHHCVWLALRWMAEAVKRSKPLSSHTSSPCRRCWENVLDIYTDELTGMLYFLTGTCRYIRWATN